MMEFIRVQELLRGRLIALAAGGTPVDLRRHDVDGGGDELAVFYGAFHADAVAYLHIAQSDGVAALAEGGVFVGDEGVGGVVD